MRYDVKTLAIASEEKVRSEDAFLLMALRPIAIYPSVALANLGVSANAVTYFNCFVVAFSFLLVLFGFVLTGIFFLYVWQLLDIIDGNIARLTGVASKLGGAVDHLTGVHVASLLPLIFAIQYFIDGGLNSQYFLIAGSAASTIILLLRFCDFYIVTELNSDHVSTHRTGFTKNRSFFQHAVFLTRQIEFPGGLQIILWTVAALSNSIHLMIALHCFISISFYCGYFLILFRRY